jgi:hypothetical protein
MNQKSSLIQILKSVPRVLTLDSQQMRWSKTGAHLMLQTRTRTLDGTLRKKFQQWYPGMKSDGDQKLAA